MVSSFTVVVAIACTLNGSGFILILYLLRKELLYIFRPNEDSETETNSTTTGGNTLLLKWLTGFYILTMISSAICCITNISLHLPFICEYIPRFHVGFATLQKVFLTLYQIGKLQYCFSSTSNKLNGYSNCTFIYLYISGILFGIQPS